MIYEYTCVECGNTFERYTTNYNQTTLPCPKCDGKAVKIISSGIFRGERRWREPDKHPYMTT